MHLYFGCKHESFYWAGNPKRQIWNNNMTNASSPDIVPNDDKDNHACIAFQPELSRLMNDNDSATNETSSTMTWHDARVTLQEVLHWTQKTPMSSTF